MTLGYILILLFLSACLGALAYVNSLNPEARIHPAPGGDKAEKKPKTERKQQDNREWETSSGETFRYTGNVGDKVQGTVESDVVHQDNTTDKSGLLTEEEIEAIEARAFGGKEYKTLNLIKARKLKKYWAGGKSARKASKQINTEGYSPRVCSDHWALFNYFHNR